MSDKLFKKEEMEELSKNPQVQSVSPKGITYPDAFKVVFLESYDQKMLPREIFEANGFPVEVLGTRRIHCA